ncbi:hypothetical protein [Ruegeria arenilitoris]|uniref:hypothetical protein n=1 Tax=Ruegeria arenilitoris TaxID=1173585 RepID=UPI001C2BA08A|nr:hypothetical protein [Ruegeria arenilitoris]
MVSIENVRNSDVIRIGATTNRPQKSAEIADTLAQLFVRDQINAKAKGLTETVSWLSDRVAGLEQEIARQEDAIKVLRAPAPKHWPRTFSKPEQGWPICKAVFKSLTNWTRHLLTLTPNTSKAIFRRPITVAFSPAFQGRSPQGTQQQG